MTDPEPTTEQRAWSEYLAWTRGAAPGQEEITEERAWHRLERALLHIRLRPWLGIVAPSDALDPQPVGGGGEKAPEGNG